MSRGLYIAFFISRVSRLSRWLIFWKRRGTGQFRYPFLNCLDCDMMTINPTTFGDLNYEKRSDSQKFQEP